MGRYGFCKQKAATRLGLESLPLGETAAVSSGSSSLSRDDRTRHRNEKFRSCDRGEDSWRGESWVARPFRLIIGLVAIQSLRLRACRSRFAQLF